MKVGSLFKCPDRTFDKKRGQNRSLPLTSRFTFSRITLTHSFSSEDQRCMACNRK